MLLGDANSKFFHAYTSIRKKQDRMRILENDGGDVKDDQEGMSDISKSYFSNLLQSSNLV